jgi:hypothetical protein
MDVVEGVDSDHVAQIVTIHLFTKKTKKIVEEKFPRITYLGCKTHVLILC